LKHTAPFTIYNASAGSGKTFSLVKEYLKKVLSTRANSGYKNLLALTFTNKAVAEMKQRIIENLVLFAEISAVKEPPAMLVTLAAETNQTVLEIHTKAALVLKHLLHHYASFSVETIDRFNHMLIRTFARDLNLSSNFEVSLDTNQLLSEAVDQLINKAGENKKITKVLLDFVLEKTDDDRSWDVSKDIVKASKLLFVENDAVHVAKLKEKSLDDFITFGATLKKEIKSLDSEISEKAIAVLDKISSEGIEHSDFMRGTLPSHFSNIKNGQYDSYGNKLQENLEVGGNALYKKATDENIGSKIDAITPFLLAYYNDIKSLVYQQKLLASALRNLVPLSVINLVQQELEVIKAEKNILPISEFNALINKEIKNEPAPFIYERLGERYRHFFIDEFQDTSLLQWNNLIPLIDNSLSQLDENNEHGSLLLVGDAKQSIYRWRGGLPEQFIDLYGHKNPFSISEIHIETLPKNYRSFNDIVKFNNAFFSFISTYFGNQTHTELYTIGNDQEINKNEEGYVEIEFLDTEKEDKDETYAQKVHDIILKAIENKFSLRDVCILTRRKKDGILLSQYLMEQGIPVISQETLLLQSSAIVHCLLNAITLSIYPENDSVKIALLDFIHDHLLISEEKHTFFSKFIVETDNDFSGQLSAYDIDFNLEKLQQISLYESCEYIIRKLRLAEKADAYLFSFLDFVYEFEQQPQADKIAFLDYWETKKESAAIAASESIDAVQLMTIHKAKGLEFPVVIFPYANVGIYNEIEAKAWFPINEDLFGFDEALINYNKEVQEFGTIGEEIFTQRQNTLELDAFNLLYVTLTRPVEQLYILTEKLSGSKEGAPVNFSQLFMSFLQNQGDWNDSQVLYSFGKNKEKQAVKKPNGIAQITPDFIASSPEQHNLKIAAKEALLWDTEAAVAIETGNLLHDTMALIKTEEDAVVVLSELKKRKTIAAPAFEHLSQTISKIMNHPKLASLFKEDELVMNERDILTKEGYMLRPDRINFHKDNSVTILDYKTGNIIEQHALQIDTYAAALEEMKYAIKSKLLVYTQGEKIVVNKV